MAEMLLINPRRRRRAPAKRKTTARRRRRNPITVAAPRAPAGRVVRRTVRRSNPVGIRRVARRRRNPITLHGNVIMQEVKAALIGGSGAVAMDVLMGQINGFLPDTLKRVPGTLGVGDAVKMALTIAVGQLLKKPTKGLSQRMAIGALTCQTRDLLATFVPADMTMGYASPARIVRGTQRVGPLMANNRMAAYLPPGSPTPLLNAYLRPGGQSPLLNGNARQREGFKR